MESVLGWLISCCSGRRRLGWVLLVMINLLSRERVEPSPHRSSGGRAKGDRGCRTLAGLHFMLSLCPLHSLFLSSARQKAKDKNVIRFWASWPDTEAVLWWGEHLSCSQIYCWDTHFLFLQILIRVMEPRRTHLPGGSLGATPIAVPRNSTRNGGDDRGVVASQLMLSVLMGVGSLGLPG